MVLPLLYGLGLIGLAIGIWRLSAHCQGVWKVGARIGAGAVVCTGVLFMLLFPIGSAVCGRYEFPPASSADGITTAVVSEEDCGAMDSFHSSIQLWRQGRAATVFTISHDPRLLKLEWEGETVLVIRYPNDYRSPNEFRCQSRWEEVQIQCIAYAPDYSKPVEKMPPAKGTFW